MSRTTDGAAEVADKLDSLPVLTRAGLDLSLAWGNGGPRFDLAAIRTGRDGVRGELSVSYENRRLSWGAFALSSTSARETLRKKLAAIEPAVIWGDHLEVATWELTQAAREGEPLVELTGKVASPTRELLSGFLYEGNPTALYADGDTGKSLMLCALLVAVQSGARLPCGLTPSRPGPVPCAYLDWETDRDTVEHRVAQIAAGLGIDPPAILYKRMTHPLVDEAADLAAEFARRGVGFVGIDSTVFALAGGDGAAFHEPMTGLFNALRLFAPAASLVLNHVTNDAAKTGSPARPFGGAFAFNGPRLIWEARRDHEDEEATSLVLTCRKANNLPRKPPPFGLRFVPGDGAITIYPLDLAEAAPQATRSVSLPRRILFALGRGATTTAELAVSLEASEDSVGRVVRRLAASGQVVCVTPAGGKGHPAQWGLATRG